VIALIDNIWKCLGGEFPRDNNEDSGAALLICDHDGEQSAAGS